MNETGKQKLFLNRECRLAATLTKSSRACVWRGELGIKILAAAGREGMWGRVVINWVLRYS